METGLEGKPWYFGLAFGGVIGAIALVGAWFYLVKPTLDSIAREEAKLADLQQEISKARAAQKDLPRFREEVRRLQIELDKLLRILPARRNVQDLIRRVRLLMERGDLNLTRFRPGTETDRDFFSEWPISITLDGTYHNLALFFDRISRLSRIINIDNLKVNARQRDDQTHSISASFTAKTFIYKDTDPELEPVETGR